MPDPTPTARDMERAHAFSLNAVVHMELDEIAMLAKCFATARAEGESAGAAKEREACELIVLRERDTTIDNYHRFDDVAAAIRARHGAPHAQ